MKIKSLKLKFLLMFLPVLVLVILMIGILTASTNRTFDRMESTLYDTVYVANTNLINGERDMYQALVADMQITSGQLQGDTDDIRGGYDANYQQVWDRLAVATDLMIEDEDAYYDMTYAFLAEKNGITEENNDDGYLEDERTLSEVVETFKSELTAYYDSYDPVTKVGDYDAHMTHLDNCEEYINNIKDFIDMYAVYQLDELEDENQSMLNMIYLTIAILILVVIAISLFVIRGIMRGVKITNENITQLAGKNLAYEPKKVKGSDEIAQMCNASVELFKSQNEILGLINEASKKINSVSDSLNTSSHDVQDTTDDIVGAINVMADRISEQAHETTQASAESKALREVVESSNQSADTLTSVSHEISDVTNEGLTIVNKLQKDTEASQVAFDRIFVSIDAISESAGKIGEASQLIANIASQTNLLSLNASIEAARVGEMGRGFAVVANEVRTLASQSADAVEAIDGMLDELKSCVKQATEQRQNVQDAVKAQSESVSATGEKYSIIVDKVKEITAEVVTLDGLSSSMDQSCRIVVDAVNNLSDSASDVAHSSQETSQSAAFVQSSMSNMTQISTDIKTLADELRNILTGFSF